MDDVLEQTHDVIIMSGCLVSGDYDDVQRAARRRTAHS